MFDPLESVKQEEGNGTDRIRASVNGHDVGRLGDP